MICSLRATLIAVMYMLKFHEKCVWHCRDLVLGGHYSSDGKSVGDGIPRSRVILGGGTYVFHEMKIIFNL